MKVLQFDQAYQDATSSQTVRDSYHALFRTHPIAFRLRTSRLEVEPHAGPFSIKVAFGGAERYDFGSHSTVVRPGEVLFTRPGATYSSTIRTSKPTDSFAIFLPPRLLERNMASSLSRFLDAGLASTSFPGMKCVWHSMAEMAASLEREDHLAAEEQLEALLHAAGLAAEQIEIAASGVSGQDNRIKAELVRRLLMARDILHESIEAGVSLSHLADAVCLSQYHLMRCFRQAFGVSIAQYLLRLRMERAGRLLKVGDRSISEVARSCGYTNLSAFGRSYRRYWSCSPSDMLGQLDAV